MVAGTESHRALLLFRQALSCVSYPAMMEMSGPPARNRTWISRLSVGCFAVKPQEGKWLPR